jgi:DNA-binding transcriptional MerR regulator
VGRSEGGIRQFTEHDLELLGLICCLKSTGMSVKHIRQYIDWYGEGDSTLEQRRDMLLAHRCRISSQIEELQSDLAKLEKKIRCYDDACAGKAGDDICVRSSK